MIELQVSLDPWLRTLAGAEAQLPFVLSTSINQVAKDAQDAVKKHVAEVFTLRKAPFILNSIKIVHFSDKAEAQPYAQISVENPQGDARSPVLQKFETGGQKAASPLMPVAIPSTNIRPAFPDLVPQQIFPKNLHLAQTEITAPKDSRVVTINGRPMRVFIRTTADGLTGVFGVPVDAIGQRRKGTKTQRAIAASFPHAPARPQLLWTFKATEPIPARLEFAATITKILEVEWSEVSGKKLAAAMATAR